MHRFFLTDQTRRRQLHKTGVSEDLWPLTK
ncbi:hypothetical protein NC651_018901 [Populus alba x Populus x berolinensis]|nr:hypothetical protein NC651_018901 [Populus alba x Populus x berolinensis]